MHTPSNSALQHTTSWYDHCRHNKCIVNQPCILLLWWLFIPVVRTGATFSLARAQTQSTRRVTGNTLSCWQFQVSWKQYNNNLAHIITILCEYPTIITDEYMHYTNTHNLPSLQARKHVDLCSFLPSLHDKHMSSVPPKQVRQWGWHLSHHNSVPEL